MGTKNTILIQIWFGPIPDYFWYHYETTKNLMGFDFLFITDQLDFKLDSKNYRVMYLDKFSLENLLYVKTKHRIEIPNNKKICDLKASLGDLFYNDIKDYQYFGFYDIDTLFGDINKINEYQLTNLKLMSDDARVLLVENFQDETFDAFHLYFPDPWPKVRHRKRRIVQDEFVNLIHRKLKPGGYIHIATDWVEYAEWIKKKFENSKLFTGGEIERLQFRPISKFEGQGIRKGHKVSDLKYFKV